MRGVPTGSGKQGKQGQNNGQGKVREFYFGQKLGKSQGFFFILGPKVRVFFSRKIPQFLYNIKNIANP